MPVAKEGCTEFHVVGVGASAGGLAALRTFFACMPEEPGFACVVVVHLPPEHESHLVSLLQPYSRMPIREVTQTIGLEPNQVYVIPPNANLTSIATHLRLSDPQGRRTERAPIDHFLRSLAETHGEKAVGVLLSGAGSDGALGIRRIKESGGLTIAQEPREAECAGMPQAAIDTGMVDLVLPMREMAEQISAFCAARPHLAGDGDVLDDEQAGFLEKILGEVRLRTGQEFAVFRPAVLLRRLRRRMRLNHVETLAKYFDVLRMRVEEPRALYNDLLLNVTGFFREAPWYETLERALDEILARKDPLQAVRIWSIHCSTGEEAYSLAMLLAEQTSQRNEQRGLLVFATDVSERAVRHARSGIYPQEIAGCISEQRLQRFFVREGSHYRVRRELREIVTFATHDLFKDPPYAHLDLIICASVFADLRPEMRRGVLNRFHYALAPHGILLVDAGDELDAQGLFTRDSGNPRVLRRVRGSTGEIEFPENVSGSTLMGAGAHAGAFSPWESPDPAAVFHAALEPYIPPSMLIDSNDQVVHFSSTAARYVRIPGGQLTRHILELLPAAIAEQASRGLRSIRTGLRSWRSEPFAVPVGGELRTMLVSIERVRGGQSNPLLLVVLEDRMAGDSTALPAPAADPLKEVVRLQNELTRAHARIAVLATTGQAQQLHDQELVEVAQELQGAREELQAVNEELVTLSDENQRRIDALAQVSNDLQYLLESTGLATLLVDPALKVVRFTPLIAQLFSLKSSDIGRPLEELKHQLRYRALLTDLQQLIRDERPADREIETQDGRWFLVRMSPYRSALRGLEGAVLVFIDISTRKRAELTVREADRRKDEFIAILAHELRNPLAPIGAGIEVLRRAPDDPTMVRRMTATMARQTQQLVRLVDDLLEVGRISSGKLTLRVEPLELAAVVRDAVAAVQPFIDAQKHDLTLDLPDEPVILEGDPARLTQVIANLLHNAARYTPRGGRVMLRASAVEDAAVIRVQDTGAGIAAESLPHVFEMFYQAGPAADQSRPGLGIGLTLAKKLVELHGGTIAVESAALNQGSTFTVRLPLASSIPLTRVGGADERRASAPSGTQRVLIVDDNVDAAETLQLLTRTLVGGEVRVASNGADALRLGAQLHPDVVLLDLGMPGMDGYEVARRMRGEPWGKDALLIAMTGWSQEEHRRRSREAGFDRHMTKPADPEALRAAFSGGAQAKQSRAPRSEPRAGV